MLLILCLFVLAVARGANSQADCVPEPVQDLQLDVDSVLHWKASLNCEDISYIIYIQSEGVIEHIYQVHETYIDVSFLPACEKYRFILVALAHPLASDGRIIETALPAVPDSNFTVSRFVATQQGEYNVLLEWSLDEKFAKCVQYFRVIHWDGETLPVDTYTTYHDIIIDSLAPCTQYDFTVTPIYNDDKEGGIGLVTYETPAHSTPLPTLENIRPGSTYADMTWGLPKYSDNRCPITSFVVDASPYLNLSVPISDTREREPVPIHVSPLQPDKMYLFQITLINSGGASAPVQIAIQTLP